MIVCVDVSQKRYIFDVHNIIFACFVPNVYIHNMPELFGNNYYNIGTTENPIYRSSSGGSGSSSGIRESYVDSYSGTDYTGKTREIYNMATSGSNDGINNSAILDITIFVDHIDSFHYRESLQSYIQLAVRNSSQSGINSSGYFAFLKGWSQKRNTSANLNSTQLIDIVSGTDLIIDLSGRYTTSTSPSLYIDLLITTSTDGLITFKTSNWKSYPLDYYIDCKITNF